MPMNRDYQRIFVHESQFNKNRISDILGQLCSSYNYFTIPDQDFLYDVSLHIALQGSIQGILYRGFCVYLRGVKNWHFYIFLFDQQWNLGAPQYDPSCPLLIHKTVNDLNEMLF